MPSNESSHGHAPPDRGEWKGAYEDGEAWSLEIEPDVFSEGRPVEVSVWMQTDTNSAGALAIFSPTEAREVAAVLMRCAQTVEDANRENDDD
jgi:hypothetical protein